MGPRSQVRWFQRFLPDLKPQKYTVWAEYYCSSTEHIGPCCSSCDDDAEYGYSMDLDGRCCCRATWDD